MYKEIMYGSNHVYERIGDDLSRYIYSNRVLYSLCNDESFIDKIVKKTSKYQEILNTITAKEDAYIYGAGKYGRIVRRLFDDSFISFIDKQHRNLGVIDGLSVIAPEKADVTKRVYISPKFAHREVLSDLLNLGFDESKIINVGKTLEDMTYLQYFDLDRLPHEENEVFLDVGAFDGQSTKGFVKWSNNQYKRIVCFEPNEECISKITIGEKDERIKVVPKGAWSNDTVLHFSSRGGEDAEASFIGAKQDDIEIPVCRIDDVIGKDNVTYIKMDIEGAELEALKGAENTIRRLKPKLAISVYHKPEDVFTLPQLVLQYNPNYSLFFRHYTFSSADTIMYAINSGV